VIEDDFINEWLQSGVILSCGDGKFLLGWGKREFSLDGTSPQFYFPDYFLKDKSWFQYAHNMSIGADILLKLFAKHLETEEAPYSWYGPDQRLFQQTFDDLKRRFSLGEINKAVPFVQQHATVTMTPLRLLHTLQNLISKVERNRSHVYGFWNDQEGILGATPEVLFSQTERGILETMACAGTKSLSTTDASFLQDRKEVHEHQLVVEGIKESLSSLGDVQAGNMSVLRLPQLAHLVTPIKVKLHSNPSLDSIIEALHPTPAVGAHPQKAGMEWLKEYQKKIYRGRYGAPAGYFLPHAQQSAFYVAIRNVQWDVFKMTIAAGCGVVPESVCDNEYEEIQLKLNAIKEMLAL